MISLEFFNYKWYNMIYACVAQPVVQLIRNEQVAGSNPVTSSKNLRKHGVFAGFFFFRNAFQNSIRNKKSHFFTE